MRDERLEVSVTFDERHGYVGTAPELPLIVALSLGGLRRKVEALMVPDAVDVQLVLDRAARLDPDHPPRAGAAPPNNPCPRLAASRPFGREGDVSTIWRVSCGG